MRARAVYSAWQCLAHTPHDGPSLSPVAMCLSVSLPTCRAMAELDGELWNEKLDWGDFYREERQKQKAVLQARKQLEERIAQDSELQIEMWQRMMEQRDEDIHTFISSFLNNKRWHWVSAEINEREALERRMLVLIERHSYERCGVAMRSC